MTPFCGLRVDGSVVCWAPFETEARIAHPPKEGRFTEISSSLIGDLVCALGADEAVTCWGDTDTSSQTPQDLKAVSVSAGPIVGACAVTTTGEVRCWDSETAFALDSMAVEPKEECDRATPCVSASVRVWPATASGGRKFGTEPVTSFRTMRSSAPEPPPAARAPAPASAPATRVPASKPPAPSALESLKAHVAELEAAPGNSKSEQDWWLLRDELARLVVEVGDAPLRGTAHGGSWTCGSDCEQLFRGWALVGRCADLANDASAPYYATVEGQSINWWWYRAAALAAHDAHLLGLLPIETRSSVEFYLSLISEGRLPPMPSPADVALVDGVLVLSKPVGWRGPKTKADPTFEELQPGSDEAVALIVGWLKLHPEVDTVEVVAKGHAKATTAGLAGAGLICGRVKRGAPTVASCSTSAEVAPADGFPLVVRVR